MNLSGLIIILALIMLLLYMFISYIIKQSREAIKLSKFRNSIEVNSKFIAEEPFSKSWRRFAVVSIDKNSVSSVGLDNYGFYVFKKSEIYPI